MMYSRWRQPSPLTRRVGETPASAMSWVAFALPTPGTAIEQANYGDTPVSRIGRCLLEADGSLANKVEQGLAFPTGGSSLLQVLTALLIGQNRQGVGGISHRITHFQHRIVLYIARRSNSQITALISARFLRETVMKARNGSSGLSGFGPVATASSCPAWRRVLAMVFIPFGIKGIFRLQDALDLPFAIDCLVHIFVPVHLDTFLSSSSSA